MKFSPALQNLIEALRCLPGVGPKSAQRMTLHLLERDREGAATLAQLCDERWTRWGTARAVATSPSWRFVKSVLIHAATIH